MGFCRAAIIRLQTCVLAAAGQLYCARTSARRQALVLAVLRQQAFVSGDKVCSTVTDQEMSPSPLHSDTSRHTCPTVRRSTCCSGDRARVCSSMRQCSTGGVPCKLCNKWSGTQIFRRFKQPMHLVLTCKQVLKEACKATWSRVKSAL
eukprot:scaffold162586_cov20-Tisochrysis_lutea.AAC.1